MFSPHHPCLRKLTVPQPDSDSKIHEVSEAGSFLRGSLLLQCAGSPSQGLAGQPLLCESFPGLIARPQSADIIADPLRLDEVPPARAGRAANPTVIRAT